MFTPNHKTFLQNVIDNELQVFNENYVSNISKLSSNLDEFENGNVLFKIPINKNPIQNLLTSTAYPVDVSPSLYEEDENLIKAKESNTLLRHVTNKVLTLGPITSLEEALDLITKYRKAAGLNFYGAILKSGNTIVNPLHILSAASLLNHKEYQSKKYKLLLYFYTDRVKSDEFFNTPALDRDKALQNIDQLLQQYPSRIKDSKVRVTSIGDMDNYNNIRVDYQEARNLDEDPTYDNYIVTHQIVTSGIIAPYYGTSLITKKHGGSSSGTHLSPIRSCNITQDYIWETNRPVTTISGSSVCTGNLSNATFEGLRSLTHSNLSSPYNSNNILPGGLGYIDIMIEKSLTLYSRAGLIDGSLVTLEPLPPFTKAELSCESLADFMTLYADKVATGTSALILENKYHEMVQYKQGLSNEQEIQPTDSNDSSEDTCEPCIG